MARVTTKKIRVKIETDTSGLDKLLENLNKLEEANWDIAWRLADEASKKLKKYVLSRSMWDAKYDLNQTGEFLQALRALQPVCLVKSAEGEKGKPGKKALFIGFGNLDVLNNIKRKPQYIGEIEIKGEEIVPVWVVLEFGTLAQADTIEASKFQQETGVNLIQYRGKKPKKRYMAGPFGAGLRKPIYLMLTKQQRGTYLHPGVKPVRMFRKALNKTMIEFQNEMRAKLLMLLKETLG